MKKFLSLTVAAFIALSPAAASARNIVISNDDGLTSNVVALYYALKDAGHDVIVSVPCGNQSGMGAAVRFMQGLEPIEEGCLNGAASPGAPGAGEMTRGGLPKGDFYYVNGTPVMALLYGIDVQAAKRWGAAPDLVLSGPNEGQNLGAIIVSSGTVSNAQYAALRGIPAIALSAGANTASATLDNPLSAVVAQRSVELVSVLDTSAANGPVLPTGLALNVNFPDEPAKAPWQISRIGTYNSYSVRFDENLAASASPTMRAIAKQHGAKIPQLPGISIGMNEASPAPGQENDESIVYRSAIAVSPMQPGYAAPSMGEDVLRWSLRPLLADQTSGKE